MYQIHHSEKKQVIMKTTVVCGVLGAGKTTFLRNILKSNEGKTVVLVNDFGSAGIDGEILSPGGIETIELPSGCICCTLRFDLITTLTKIKEQFAPDHLFIEPSGIASPSGVTEVLDTLNIGPATVVGIVDATEFIDAYESEMYGWFFKSQVTRSDIVLVNKTDLVDKGKKEATLRLVESLNQNAVIVPTVNAEIDTNLLQHSIPSPQKEHSEGHAIRIETVTVKFKKPVPLEYLRGIFEKMVRGEFGTVLRAKALVQTDMGPYRLDFASKQTNSEAFENEVKNSRLVVIGTDLKEEKIREIGSGEARK
jgi:G3E family GTPase